MPWVRPGRRCQNLFVPERGGAVVHSKIIYCTSGILYLVAENDLTIFAIDGIFCQIPFAANLDIVDGLEWDIYCVDFYKAAYAPGKMILEVFDQYFVNVRSFLYGHGVLGSVGTSSVFGYYPGTKILISCSGLALNTLIAKGAVALTVHACTAVGTHNVPAFVDYLTVNARVT